MEINKKTIHNYYEREALIEDRQKAMYSGNKWDSYWHLVLQNKVATALRELVHGESFLDVGCAEGLYIKCFEKYNPHGMCVGVDIAKNYLNKAKIGLPNAAFVQADAEYLPFKNREFDIVLCSETLEHVLNPNKAFLELLRVSRKYLIISVPGHTPFYYFAKFLGLVKEEKLSQMLSSPGKGHINDIPLESLERWLSESGAEFKFIEKFRYCYFPPQIAKKVCIPIFFLILFDKFIFKTPIINKRGLVQYAIIKSEK